MLEGIYHVSFSSGSQSVGQGIAVIKGDSINGGDPGYLYTGTKSATSEGQFKSTLKIHQWNTSTPSIFGSIKEFALELSGSISGDKGFLAHGHVSGQPHSKITIRGRYLSAAA